MEDPHGGRDLEIVNAESSSRPRRSWKASKSSAASGGREKKKAEAKRRKRVAKYNLYGVESKFKASLKSGLRWLKKRCSRLVGLR